MWISRGILIFSIFLGVSSVVLRNASAANQDTAEKRNAVAQSNERVRTVDLDVFVRLDQETSKSAKRFAEELEQRTPGLAVHVHDVLTDKVQLKRLYDLSKKSGRTKPVVPAFASCNQMFFGFVNAGETEPRVRSLWTMEVYSRSTCPRCQQAKKLIPKLQARWPAVHIQIRDVSADPEARSAWQAICRGEGKMPGLPTVKFGGRVFIGYDGDEITGRKWEEWITKVASTEDKPLSRSMVVPPGFLPLLGLGLQQEGEIDELELPEEFALPGEAAGDESGIATIEPTEPESSETDDSVDLPFFGRVSVSEFGLPLFTLAVGLVDGFNPCAMWILVFLLSILVNIKDRRKIILIAGTFVVVSGLAYFAFMAAWLHLFLLVGIARPVQVALGLLACFIGSVNVKDFFAFKKGITLSIPESSKPGLYRRVREIVRAKSVTVALFGAVSLAIVVNMVELLCTSGLPAIYTRILTLHQLPWWQNYAYLAFYNMAYMFDDSVLLTIAVVTLSNRKLQEREGRWLKLVSGVVILGLGLVMLFKPEWLAFH